MPNNVHAFTYTDDHWVLLGMNMSPNPLVLTLVDYLLQLYGSGLKICR